MVFQKSLTRELTLTAIAVFAVLLAILVSTQAINLLGRAAEGQISNEAVTALIGFWALGLFPLLLILTVFVSTMTVLTRLWREHEMEVWLAAGQSLYDICRPVLRFAIPLSLLVAVCALFIGPWAEGRSQQYAEQLKQREEISAIAPGVFKETGNASRVYFIENYAGTGGSANHIFFQDMSQEKVMTILAQAGHIETGDKGQRLMVLERGHRYTGTPGAADYEAVYFDRYTVAIGEQHRLIDLPGNRQSITTAQLLTQHEEPEARSELIWRLSMPLSCLVLALLAVPLSYFNPRGGQTYNLLIAVLVYFVYQNALTLVRNAVLNGKTHALTMLAVHVAAALVALAGLHYRNRPATTLGRTLRKLTGRRQAD